MAEVKSGVCIDVRDFRFRRKSLNKARVIVWPFICGYMCWRILVVLLCCIEPELMRGSQYQHRRNYSHSTGINTIVHRIVFMICYGVLRLHFCQKERSTILKLKFELWYWYGTNGVSVVFDYFFFFSFSPLLGLLNSVSTLQNSHSVAHFHQPYPGQIQRANHTLQICAERAKMSSPGPPWPPGCASWSLPSFALQIRTKGGHHN